MSGAEEKWPGETTAERMAGRPGPLHVVDREEVRLIAKEESRAAVASLCGLVMRRLQDDTSPGAVDVGELSKIFGEALQQYSGTAS